MTPSASDLQLNGQTSDRTSSIIWLLVVAGLFLNLTLKFGDSGRVLLLSVFDVVLVALVVLQILRVGLQWQAQMIWPLATIFLIVIVASATFYFGENIKIAGLLRETIKYLGFLVGVTICGLLYRGGTLASPSIPVMVVLGILSLAMWFIQFEYFLPPDKIYLAVNSYSNACLGLSVLAMYLLRDHPNRGVWLGIAVYQACVLAGCVLLNTTAMSIAALLILTVTIATALGIDRIKFNLVRESILVCLSIVCLSTVVFLNPQYIEALLPETWRQAAVIRLGLWKTAGELALTHFPYGIGPGQFGELGLIEYQLWVSLKSKTLEMLGLEPFALVGGLLPMRFVHNTFLAMLVEWGVVALFLLAMLGAVIWQVLKIRPFTAALCYLLYLLPTLMLHDGLGFRAHYLILGFGVLAFLQDRRST